MFRKDRVTHDVDESTTFFKKDPEDAIEEDAEETEEQTNDSTNVPKQPRGITEVLQSIYADVSSKMTEQSNDKEIVYLPYVLKLIKGERIISDPVKVNDHLEVRFISLGSMHRQFIGQFAIDPEKKDEAGNPIVNEAMNRSMTIAMMWHSMKAIGTSEWEMLPDVFDRESGFETYGQILGELDRRNKILLNWPAPWTSEFEKGLIEFNDKLIAATGSTNVRNFSEAPSASS